MKSEKAAIEESRAMGKKALANARELLEAGRPITLAAWKQFERERTLKECRNEKNH